MARTRGVTIHDVARRAGVSISAVSMALNDTGTLSAATRLRVRAVAEEMDYQADALARGLRRSSVGAIGLVMRSLDSLGSGTDALGPSLLMLPFALTMFISGKAAEHMVQQGRPGVVLSAGAA